MQRPLAAPAQGVALSFANVSKRFELNRHKQRSLLDLGARLVGKSEEREYFWPINGVSFEIPRGVTVGIIGENGAGKSTLLKLVSRILHPTSGTVQINGRVSALLELGAGFHPELTGRDNIYLHCSLLGMTREQTSGIVERVERFADLGAFIDTPVKHYSSGMYARLGFAIAVHVEPEILLVDEVLAVGDEGFQRRCLDTIEQMRARGVTILLVSHSLGHVLDLCDNCLWLDEGRVRAFGPTQDVVRAYIQSVDDDTAQRLIAENALHEWLDDANPAPNTLPPRRWGSGPLRILGVQMVGNEGAGGWTFRPQEPVTIRIRYSAAAPVAQPVFSVLIHKSDGHYLWASNTMDHPVPPIPQAGEGTLTVAVQGLALTAGRYRLSAAAYAEPDPPYWPNPSDYHEQLYDFQIVSAHEIHGDVVLPSSWQHEPPHSQSQELPAGVAHPAQAGRAPIQGLGRT